MAWLSMNNNGVINNGANGVNGVMAMSISVMKMAE
jgi:hypothetical protein